MAGCGLTTVAAQAGEHAPFVETHPKMGARESKSVLLAAPDVCTLMACFTLWQIPSPYLAQPPIGLVSELYARPGCLLEQTS